MKLGLGFTTFVLKNCFVRYDKEVKKGSVITLSRFRGTPLIVVKKPKKKTPYMDIECRVFLNEIYTFVPQEVLSDKNEIILVR